MKVNKLLVLICSTFLFTACSSDDDDNDSTDRLEITLEDTRKHRVLKTVSITYSGDEIGKQLDPGDAGKGVTWDFSNIDLSKYSYKEKLETEGKAIDYSTSKFKDYFPKATECYITKNVRTLYYSTNQYVYSFNSYDYLDGNITYGEVEYDDYEFSDDAYIVNYNPAVTEPYPQYLGLKYTVETTSQDDDGDSYTAYLEIDGEGTIILPGGKKFTDVLRRKITYSDEEGEYYSYISKQAGVVLSFTKGNDSFEFRDN
ncbi:MAG: hypothetical protein LBQ84_02530 [Flavobacteriaceae bacterium]|jgi:hypothetical protein|nr:hypothetical protein [Flavobacteriaceae bacterium]